MEKSTNPSTYDILSIMETQTEGITEMTYEEMSAITREMEALFCSCEHGDPDRFCEEDCTHTDLCDQHELFWGCGVWEDSMGEDL